MFIMQCKKPASSPMCTDIVCLCPNPPRPDVLGQYGHLHLGFRVLHSCNHLLRQLPDVLGLGILQDSQIAFNTLRRRKNSPFAAFGPRGGGMQGGGAALGT